MAVLYDGSAPPHSASTGGPTWARRCLLGLAALFLGMAMLAPAGADSGSRRRPNPFKPDTSSAARASAVRSIPIKRLDDDARRKVAGVLSQTSVFRRMPIQVVPCDPDMYLFLVRNPEVVVDMWRVLGVSKLSLKKTGPDSYRLTDGEGTQGRIEVIHRNHDTHIAYTDCKYEGPLLKTPIRYWGLLILKSGYVREPDGRYYVTSRLDTFSCFKPGGVEFLTQTFHPVFGKVADANFAQTAAFASSLSRTAQLKPRSIRRLADRLSRVSPEIRQELAEVAVKIAEKDVQARRDTPVRPAAHQTPLPATAVRKKTNVARR